MGARGGHDTAGNPGGNADVCEHGDVAGAPSDLRGSSPGMDLESDASSIRTMVTTSNKGTDSQDRITDRTTDRPPGGVDDTSANAEDDRFEIDIVPEVLVRGVGSAPV